MNVSEFVCVNDRDGHTDCNKQREMEREKSVREKRDGETEKRRG